MHLKGMYFLKIGLQTFRLTGSITKGGAVTTIPGWKLRTLNFRISSLKRTPAEFENFVTCYLQQRLGLRASGLWRTNVHDFDDADFSSSSILRSSQPCFPEVSECDGHANATWRCPRDVCCLWCHLNSSYSELKTSPTYTEANMEFFWKCFSSMFLRVGQKSTHLLGRCLWAPPTLFSRNAPDLSDRVDMWTQLWSPHRCWPGLRSRLQLDHSKTLIFFGWNQTFLYWDLCFLCCSERGNESSCSAFYLRPLCQTWLVFGTSWRSLAPTEEKTALEDDAAALLFTGSNVFTPNIHVGIKVTVFNSGSHRPWTIFRNIFGSHFAHGCKILIFFFQRKTP